MTTNTYIGVGFSSHADPLEAAKIASSQAKKQIHQKKPNLIIVFSSVHFQGRKLLEGICYIFGENTNILGCTGSGVITEAGVLKYGVAIMAITSTKIKFGIGAVPQINKDHPRESGEQFARSALKNLGAHTKGIGLIFSDGLIEKGSELLDGVKEILGRSFPIIGGSAADNLHFSKTYQYYNKDTLNNALIGTILSGEGIFGYGLKHGWRPLGRPHIVTQSSGNIIQKIEDGPAIEIYKDYFKKTLEEIKSLLIQISVLYPLGIYLSEEEEYLLRNVMHINPDGGIVCQGDVHEGSQVRIMLGTKETALEAAQQAALEAKNPFKHTPALGAIVFESVSRINLLGHRANEEINIVKNTLGENIPFIGVCTFGEQAPLKSLEYRGESHFHNEAIAILTIGERHALAE
ncbi:MAG: FIST N-terminal domain-containing protein [Candidatus Omnitrophica bacterium]|nr:FIST N-terminal domain-containing protein [Candidatus Omnitrophota bacterium]MDD5351573.1 FIST N-terminal domain-containing protein [Candidatus Omnitrophota bacterium]MDD5551008.1 FIST N-terminal domain-containing protein [Candidatus Omnitrophota bacterium]